MNGKDFVLFLIGLLTLAFGIFLIIFFWNSFVTFLKGIIGFIAVLIGLGIAFFGFSKMKDSIK